MQYSKVSGRDLLHRWEGNPAITIEDIPFQINTVFNGTPIVTDEGVYLLLRIEGLEGYSFRARSTVDTYVSTDRSAGTAEVFGCPTHKT
jgi:hypothetical protein